MNANARQVPHLVACDRSNMADTAYCAAVTCCAQCMPHVRRAPCRYVTDDGRHGNGSFSQCLDVVHRIMPDHNCSAPAPASALGRHGGGGGSGGGGVTGSARAAGLAHTGRTLSSEADAAAAGRSQSGAGSGKAGGEEDVVPSESYGNEEEVVLPGDNDGSGGSSGSGGTESEAGGHGGHGSDGVGGSGGGCVLQGSYVPALAGKFVAVENFAWTARALGLPSR